MVGPFHGWGVVDLCGCVVQELMINPSCYIDSLDEASVFVIGWLSKSLKLLVIGTFSTSYAYVIKDTQLSHSLQRSSEGSGLWVASQASKLEMGPVGVANRPAREARGHEAWLRDAILGVDFERTASLPTLDQNVDNGQLHGAIPDGLAVPVLHS